MKKIGFLCESVLSVGGVQRVLAVIAIALSKTYDVTIISMEDTEESDHSLYDLDKSNAHLKFFYPAATTGLNAQLHRICSGIYKKYLPKNNLTNALYAHTSFPYKVRQQYIRELNSYAFDTIIAVHGGLSMKLATIRRQLQARRVIGWMHNSYEAFFENTPCYYPGIKDFFLYQMRQLDDFIVLCQADAAHYEAQGLHPTVIYNPLTLKPGKPCNLNAKRFLSIGRMTPLHKGFDILIKAFALFAQHNSDWHLDIVGEGPEEETLRSLIKEKGMQARIHLHPFIHHIQDYYSAASCYVLASRWEGFGLVLIEAASHYIPIISSSLPVTKELLSPDCTLFFPSGEPNALAEAMETFSHLSPAQFEEKSQQSHHQIDKFTIEIITDSWNKIL